MSETQRKEVQDALFDWISDVLSENVPVIWNNTGGVRPKPPFISLQMIGGSRKTFPWHSGVDSITGCRLVRHEMKKTVSIHGWGEKSLELLDDILDSLDNEKYRLMLRQKGLVVLPLSNISLSAESRANGTENHGYFDIEVSYIRIVQEEIGWIERASIDTDLPANSEIDIQEENNGRD